MLIIVPKKTTIRLMWWKSNAGVETVFWNVITSKPKTNCCKYQESKLCNPK